MGPFRVFVDANILFSKTMRDWLFLLRIETEGNLFALLSSEDVIVEALYHLRKRQPDAPGEYTERIRERIRGSLDDVVAEFPAIPFPGDDPHDAHVHAAATECQAKYLIANDKGFQAIDTDVLEYEVHTADSFFMLVAANAPSAVDRVIVRQAEHYRKRGGNVTLADALAAAGCPQFAECVRQHARRMAQSESTHGVAESLLAAR